MRPTGETHNCKTRIGRVVIIVTTADCPIALHRLAALRPCLPAGRGEPSIDRGPRRARATAGHGIRRPDPAPPGTPRTRAATHAVALSTKPAISQTFVNDPLLR